MAVSKRLRTEILRRDNSTCQKCGAKAPDVPLVVDHVIPVTLGGSDEPANLQALCEPCNSGKSATPPDAATVAKVADDAARWARAMEAAAGETLGARGAREEARAAFDAKWNSWSEGRPPLPRPNGWEVSVDSFIKAGLPVPVLLDCVDIAMSRRHVRSGDVFKYMCGIAWKEVRQLQKDAHTLLAPGASAVDAPDEVVDLWEEAVSELLDTFTPDERKTHGIEAAEMFSLEVDEEGRYPIAAAFDSVLSDLRSDLWSLSYFVHDLLSALPDGIGERAMKITVRQMYDRLGDPELITRHRFAEWAVKVATRLYAVRDATEYLDQLPDDQRQAWMAYAETVRGTRAGVWGYVPWEKVGEGHRHLHAANHARAAKQGLMDDAMCQAAGEVIEACPRPAVYLALLEETECCDGKSLPEHGHPICEEHLAFLVDRSYVTPDGDVRTIRDFTEFVLQSEEPPF